MKVCDKALAADTACKDPLRPDSTLNVVAVMSSVSWGVGVTDTLYLAGQVSAPNRQDIQMLADLDLGSIEILFKHAKRALL